MKHPSQHVAGRFLRLGIVLTAVLGFVFNGASLHPAPTKPPLALDPLFAEIVAEFGEHAICLWGGQTDGQETQAEPGCLVDCCPMGAAYSIAPFSRHYELFRAGPPSTGPPADFLPSNLARYDSDIALRGPPPRS